MKFNVKTYFHGEKPSKKYSFLAYVFNLFYRSAIPIMIVYSLLEWEGKPFYMTAFFLVALSFFVFYQFTWEVT